MSDDEKFKQKSLLETKRDFKIAGLAEEIAQELCGPEMVIIRADHIDKVSGVWGGPVEIKE